MKTWGKLRDAVCGVQGTRTGALVSTVVGALSKPMGYLRTLLLAWLFGASAGMDAFYLAMGILSLIGQIVSDVAESALLPRLPRLGDTVRRSMAGASASAGSDRGGGVPVGRIRRKDIR